MLAAFILMAATLLARGIAAGQVKADSAGASEADGATGTAGVTDTAWGGPDSLRVSDIEEQSGGAPERELERDPGPRPRTVRTRAWRARWTVRAGASLQAPAAYGDGTYAGDRLKTLQRLSVTHSDRFAAEVLADKDPGESSSTDFVSAALGVRLLEGSVRLVAGDYRVRAGRGLLFGPGRRMSKGVAAIAPAAAGSWGLADGISADESRFFRGAAMEGGWGPVSATAFVSDRRVSPLVSEDGTVRGLDATGYHRTGAELAHRASLRERSAGGSFRIMAAGAVAAGVNLLSTSLRGPADLSLPAGAAASRRWSFDLTAAAGGMSLFGEVVPVGEATPWIAGALFDDGGGRRIVVLRRRYPPGDAWNPVGGFGDGSSGSNEEGTYLGVEAVRRGGTAISGYVDLFSKIAPARGAVHPARGVDALVRIAVRLSEEVGVEGRYRVRETEAGTSAGGGPLPVPGNGTEIERRVRAEVRYDPRAGLESTARFDYCVASPPDGPAGRGGMLTVEIGARAWKRLALEGRLRFFRSSSFESGIPAVETMIPGTIASSVYWGEGVAWSAGAALTWSRHVRLSVRYTFLRRDDLRRIGSGPSALPSNVRETAGLQLDLEL